MRKIKCKYCNEYILVIEDVYSLVEKTSTGNEKKTNLHQKCVNEYRELMHYKTNETKWFNELYEHVKELLDYTSQQKLPDSLITRIKDMRNGTIMQQGVGRVVKSNEGYPYEVIFDTFLSCGNSIRWNFENKIFEKESQKINYMMRIIDSNINNNYVSFKNKLDTDVIKQRDNMIEEEKNIENNQSKLIIQNPIITKINKGISDFLDEDEF
jgi:hypothetical protein